MAKRAHSSIEKLSPAGRDLVDDLLDTGTTYPEIIAKVQEAEGQTLTKSALSRYHTRRAADRLREEMIEREIQAAVEAFGDQPKEALKKGIGSLFWKRVAKAMAKSEGDLDRAGALELAHLYLAAQRTEQRAEQLALQREALKSGVVDRPAVYLECLKEFTDYLTHQAPSALGALGETFDGFMEQVRKTHAAQAAH